MSVYLSLLLSPELSLVYCLSDYTTCYHNIAETWLVLAYKISFSKGFHWSVVKSVSLNSFPILFFSFSWWNPVLSLFNNFFFLFFFHTIKCSNDELLTLWQSLSSSFCHFIKSCIGLVLSLMTITYLLFLSFHKFLHWSSVESLMTIAFSFSFFFHLGKYSSDQLLNLYDNLIFSTLVLPDILFLVSLHNLYSIL